MSRSPNLLFAIGLTAMTVLAIAGQDRALITAVLIITTALTLAAIGSTRRTP